VSVWSAREYLIMLSVESEDEGESCERAILLRSGFGIIAGQQAETII
jgi:hypothetical protein